jgi:hypothetical protein
MPKEETTPLEVPVQRDELNFFFFYLVIVQ